jgi:hypothetical protein
MRNAFKKKVLRKKINDLDPADVGVQVGLDDSGVNAVDPHVTVLLILQLM